MHITAVCCTYNRPELLANAVAMFERQTHEDRSLLILDDARQFYSTPQRGDNDRWLLISLYSRFRSFGMKRNHCINRAIEYFSPDAIAIWDDDDGYMPWALESINNALEQGPWCRPSLVIDNSTEWGDRGPILAETADFQQSPHAISYHGAWAYRLDAWQAGGGYPEDYAGDCDTALGTKIRLACGPSVDPIGMKFPLPYYVYCLGRPPVRFNDFENWNRMQAATDEDVEKWGKPEFVGKLEPKLPDNWDEMQQRCCVLRDLPRVPWNERPEWKA